MATESLWAESKCPIGTTESARKGLAGGGLGASVAAEAAVVDVVDVVEDGADAGPVVVVEPDSSEGTVVVDAELSSSSLHAAASSAHDTTRASARCHGRRVRDDCCIDSSWEIACWQAF
jgi:hypothetical protein